LPFAAAIAFFALSFWQWQLAQADSIRKNPSPETVPTAISLDPLNAYGYTLWAEILQQRGQDSSHAWAQALQKAPRDPEIWIRLALDAETKNDPARAERLLLKAASLSKTWVPRWSLATFYARQGNPASSLQWARACAERSTGDLRPLFQLIESSGIAPADLPRSFLPKNRAVLLAYLQYRATHPDLSSLEFVADELLNLIPTHTPGFPGLDSDPLSFASKRRFPLLAEERKAFLSVLDRLLAASQGRRAVLFLNRLIQCQILKASPFHSAQLISNPNFSDPPVSNPFDWQYFRGADVAIDIDSSKSLATVSLSGTHRESLVLLSQIIFIPKEKNYRFQSRYSCKDCPDPSGFQWQFAKFGSPIAIHTEPFLSPSENGTNPSSVPFQLASSSEDRLWILSLHYRRPSGVARQAQSLQIDSVALVEQQ
jgi:hypothetical protein